MPISKPTISVLMAVYDTPIKYLDVSIASVLQQSLLSLEFIIVDDGSNSVTGNQLELWARRDHRIRLLKLPKNLGLTKALNLGLQIASGNFLARQDADDISGAHRFAAQLEYLTLNPEVDAVATDVILIDLDGSKVGYMKIDPKLRGLKKRNLLVHGSMLFRRRVFDLLVGYDDRMKLSQDYELYLRMIVLHSMKIGVLSKDHYFLRMHSESLSNRKMMQQLYYAVMAKKLSKLNISRFNPNLAFWITLLFDYLFVHHLFIGAILSRVSYFSHKKTSSTILR
jgi:glycosyltransferase involved in cell wall biosynthesis